ncbi:hypothetical protein CY35_09G066000 [Sphagnum magellanicum]|nr:hypothetical protein CY35_09G066000 [Sphagnum magellanicum]
MTQSMMMRSAVHVAPLCVDKMQQQRIDHLGLETVECIFRRSSNMFWGVGVEDWSCRVAEKKRVQHLQVEDLQGSKVVVSVRAGSSDQIIPATQRMPPNHKIKAASLLVFQELCNATANRYMNAKSSILVLGLSVHSTPVEMREKLAVPEAEWPHAIAELSAQNHITKAAVLNKWNSCGRPAEASLHTP